MSMSTGEILLLQEAVNSTAIEHSCGCDCRTCRAADGDTEAFTELISEIVQKRTEDNIQR